MRRDPSTLTSMANLASTYGNQMKGGRRAGGSSDGEEFEGDIFNKYEVNKAWHQRPMITSFIFAATIASLLPLGKCSLSLSHLLRTRY